MTFSNPPGNPQKWLSESFLKGFEKADFTSEKEKLTEQIKQALWDLESFFRYHLDNDAKEFPKAAYLENVQLILDEISSLNQESDSQAYQAVLARVVAISKEKNGRSLTNASRKADLKPLADAYNEERKTQFAKLGQLSDQITILDYQERYHGDTWELAKTFQTFMSDFVEAYRQRKRQENAFEFADISHYTIEILEKFPQVREAYQERFHEVMVDEYQDTNHAQYQLVKLLASRFKNICVVGDADQSIYGWRGADMQNILDFEKDYPDAKVVLLEENYRSTKTILQAANDVIKNNRNRRPKNLWTQNADGEEIVYYRANNEQDEAVFVAKTIEELSREAGYKHRDFAVLYRTNAQSRTIEEALLKSNIPYTMVGGTKFYSRKEIRDVMLI